MGKANRRAELDQQLGEIKGGVTKSLQQARPLLESVAAEGLGRLITTTSLRQKVLHPYEYLRMQLTYRRAVRHLDLAVAVVECSNGALPSEATESELQVPAEAVEPPVAELSPDLELPLAAEDLSRQSPGY